MVGAEEDLRARGNRRKSSILYKAFGKDAGMMDEFQALQVLKRNRAKLKSMVQLYADFNWNGYVPYKAKMRVWQKKRPKNERKPSLN